MEGGRGKPLELTFFVYFHTPEMSAKLPSSSSSSRRNHTHSHAHTSHTHTHTHNGLPFGSSCLLDQFFCGGVGPYDQNCDDSTQKCCSSSSRG